MHFLKIIVLRGELMRFIIYVHNLQQYMHARSRSTRKICTTQIYIVTVIIVPNLIMFVHCKEYNIDKTLRFMVFDNF